MDKELIEVPTTFRVIGVGDGMDNVINTVNSYGFAGVSAEVVNYPDDCIPNDYDQIAIIVFSECAENADRGAENANRYAENANRIAKRFHDAGVLTIGFSKDADTSCYDAIMQNISGTESSKVIKELLQPTVTPCLINYDSNDLCITLRDSGFFIVKTASGSNVTEATDKLQTVFEDLDLKYVKYVTIHLYFKSKSYKQIALGDMASLFKLMLNLAETKHVLFSVNHDESLNDEETKLSVILAGKEVWKCSKH